MEQFLEANKENLQRGVGVLDCACSQAFADWLNSKKRDNFENKAVSRREAREELEKKFVEDFNKLMDDFDRGMKKIKEVESCDFRAFRRL